MQYEILPWVVLHANNDVGNFQRDTYGNSLFSNNDKIVHAHKLLFIRNKKLNSGTVYTVYTSWK